MGSLFSSKPQTQTQTTVQNQSSSSATTPNAANQVQSFLANQLNVASQPYQGTAQPIAGFSPLQQQAFGLGQSNVGAYQPYLAGAQSALTSGTTPAYANVDQYMSPYINDVVKATQNQFALQNAQQLQQVRGNAAAQGALGGDREGVAEALAAQAQNMAQAPVIAGLYNTGYQNALNTAGADASRQLQAAQLYGSLGGQAQQYGQNDINSLYNLGAQQQANEQANLTSQWQNSQNALAYPFQTGQYYAGLLGSLGGLEGSTSTGSSSGTGTGTGTVTPAQPSLGAQLLGAGLSAASLFAPVPYTTAANGGRVGYAGGGLAVPYGGSGYVPATVLAPAQVPTSPLPPAPAPMQMSAPSNVARPTGASDLVKEALGIASQLRQNGIRTPPSDDGAMGRVAERFGVAQPSSTSPAASSGGSSAPGSWYSQFRGSNYNWVDPSDKPGSNALGVPDSSQGIALPSRSTLGKWFNVTAPNGQTLRLQQTDIGPARWTGRGIDIAASAADRFGYSPKSFPTGGSFSWVPAEAQGGRIGFADGGAPSFDEMWQDRIAPQDVEGPPMPQGLGTQGADASGRAPWPDTSAAPPPPAPPPPDLGGGSPDELNPRGGVASAGPSAPSSASSAPSGLGLSPDLRMALLAAGSKLMSTPGPIGVALGEGLGTGVSTYAAAQAVRNQLAHQALNDERLNRAEARQEAAQRETERANRAREDIHRAQLEKPVNAPYGSTLVNPRTGETVYKSDTGTLSQEAEDVAAVQLTKGDLSGLQGLYHGRQGAENITRVRNNAAQRLIAQGMTPEEAGTFLSTQLKAFKASMQAEAAGARTVATREANLDVILRATEAAIPAAIEASKAVARTGWVPLNKIIQKGQVIASDPKLRRFGMSNLQLAEHWARAMNPTGVMRESDRDLALGFLSTADSPETYAEVADQLHTQILRERQSLRKKGEGESASARPTAPSRPTATGKNGEKYILSEDGKSWQKMQ